MTTTAVAPDSLPSKAQKRLDMAWAEDLQMTNTQRAVDFYADQNSGRERPTPNAGYQRHRVISVIGLRVDAKAPDLKHGIWIDLQAGQLIILCAITVR